VEQNTNEPKKVNTPVFANIMEKDNRFILEAALPGFTTDEIKIEQHENKITVSGNKKLQYDGKIHRQEFHFSSFERVFVLPADVQSDNIEATFKNGILTLVILKSEVKAPKVISVK
jgi:HSP20 family protein